MKIKIKDIIDDMTEIINEMYEEMLVWVLEMIIAMRKKEKKVIK